jgi:hypothetical protein
VLHAPEQVPLRQVEARVDRRVRETDRPPLLVGRARIAPGEGAAQQCRRHAVPFARVAARTERLRSYSCARL